MNILDSILLGAVQGLTEWLPVSSSGHLVLAHKWLGLHMPLAFGVILHLATALVIVIMFRNDIMKMIKGVLDPGNGDPSHGIVQGSYWKRVRRNPDALFGWWIIVGTLPIACIGVLFFDLFEVFFDSAFIVGIALAGSGIILALSAAGIKKKGKKNLSVLDAYSIGLGQGLALIPGLSRSGLTIGIGLMRNIDRETAARYSILLAVPAIIGAAIWEFVIMLGRGANDIDVMTLFVGGITAFIVGYFAIKLLLYTVRRAGFHYFAAYCFVLTAIIMVTL